MTTFEVPAGGRLALLPAWAQWLVLLVLSLVLGALLELAGIPAALLLGPMIAGILVGTNGGAVRVPRLPYFAAQTIIAMLIAGSITSTIIASFLAGWPVFIGIVLSVIAASSFMGWLMSRFSILPGSTAVWGSSPGAASAMMLMAEAFGADIRLVAFMQYLRVVFVAVAASLIARFWVDVSGVKAPEILWFPPIDWLPFVQTLAIAGIGGLAGWLIRIPAGVMLVPLAVGSALHAGGLVQIELPQWLLALSYAMIGWSIGLGFTRQILVHASRALPQIIASIIALMAFCGLLAFALIQFLGLDPLTAYLATSPGGMDSIAIIAASSNVDVPFVMALQTARLLMIMAIGPSLARFVASKAIRPR